MNVIEVDRSADMPAWHAANFHKIESKQLTMTSNIDTDPPVTIVEDETEDDHDGDRSSWNTHEPSHFVSPKCDKLVQSFNKELEQLTKSLDESLLLQQHSFAPNQRTSDDNSLPMPNISKTPGRHSHHYTSAGSVPLGIKDPPASAYRRSTPARSKILRPGTTPEEPPPEPVQTPVFPVFETPASFGYRRNEEKEADGRYRGTKSYSSDISWEASIQNMVDTLSRQEERIRELERENEELREQLNFQNEESRQKQEQTRSADLWEGGAFTERSNRGESGTRKDSCRTYQEGMGEYSKGFGAKGNYRGKAEEPYGRAASIASSYRTFPSPGRIRSPPRRGHAGSVTTFGESAFSPGTCFVGELSRLMKMEKGHHAPLSVIIDKHWDQLRDALDNDRGYD